MKLFENFVIQLMEFKKKIKKISITESLIRPNMNHVFQWFFQTIFHRATYCRRGHFFSNYLNWKLRMVISKAVSTWYHFRCFCFLSPNWRIKTFCAKNTYWMLHVLNSSQNIVPQTFYQACGPCFTCCECGCSNMQKHRRS